MNYNGYKYPYQGSGQASGLTYYQLSYYTNLTVSNCTMNWNYRYGFFWQSNYYTSTVSVSNCVIQYNCWIDYNAYSITGWGLSAVFIYIPSYLNYFM